MSTIMPGLMGGPERGTKFRRLDIFEHGEEVNVGSTERAVTSLLGGAMVAGGVAVAWRGRQRGGAWVTAATLMGAGGALIYRGVTDHCGGYEAMGVTGDDADAAPWSRAIHVRHSVTVQKSADELYGFWRTLSNLPQIMPHLKEVEELGDGLSRWKADGPTGPVAWTAKITEDRPGEVIAWETQEGEAVAHAGRVAFRPATGDRGTVVRATFDYQPVGGVLGALVAKVFGQEPGQQVKEDLRRFKAHMEAGTAPTTAGQPRGRCR